MEVKQDARPGKPWRRKLAWFVAAVVAVSIVARVVLHEDAPPPPRTGGSRLVADQPPAAENGGGEAGGVLPYVTEGGIAMLLGLALGVATRAVLKIALVLLAAFFVLAQVLAHKGILTIDWGAFGEALRNFVLNVSSEEGLGGIVKHKLPTGGGFLAGYLIGLKR